MAEAYVQHMGLDSLHDTIPERRHTMIGLWIDAQDDEVLGRLASVELRDWNPGICTYSMARNIGMPGSGCLICHAFDCQVAGSYSDRKYDVPSLVAVEGRYIELSRRFGDARIGHLISERASRILRERRLEAWRNRPKGVSEQEASVYFRTHVSLNCEPVEVGA